MGRRLAAPSRRTSPGSRPFGLSAHRTRLCIPAMSMRQRVERAHLRQLIAAVRSREFLARVVKIIQKSTRWSSSLCKFWMELMFGSVLFFSRPRSEGWPHQERTFSILSLSSVILIDSFRGNPVHVLMLSIQAVRGIPRLRASHLPLFLAFSFYKQLPCFLTV